MAYLSTVAKAKLSIGIPSTDTSMDSTLTQWLGEVDSLIRLWARQQWAVPPAVYTELPACRGTDRIRLREGPVIVVVQTGTLTGSSAVVTGLTDTSSLVVGMPCVATAYSLTSSTTSPVPPLTTIASIDSSSQVTLSRAATGSGSYQLAFGVDVYYDPGGLYGTGRGAFATTPAPGTQLLMGYDYDVPADQADLVSSKSRLLVRTNGVWPAVPQYTRGLLAPSMVAARGTLKVIYAAGFLSVPPDLELACNLAVANVYRSRQGAALASVSYDGFSQSWVQGKKSWHILGDAALSALSRWANTSLGT